MRLKNKKLFSMSICLLLSNYAAATVVEALELATLLPQQAPKDLEQRAHEAFITARNKLIEEAQISEAALREAEDKIRARWDEMFEQDKQAPAPKQTPAPKVTPPIGKTPPPPPPLPNFGKGGPNAPTPPPAPPLPKVAPTPPPAPKQAPNQAPASGADALFEELKKGKAKKQLDPELKRFNELSTQVPLGTSALQNEFNKLFNSLVQKGLITKDATTKEYPAKIQYLLKKGILSIEKPVADEEEEW